MSFGNVSFPWHRKASVMRVLYILLSAIASFQFAYDLRQVADVLVERKYLLCNCQNLVFSAIKGGDTVFELLAGVVRTLKIY
jgi:hypothetical protein